MLRVLVFWIEGVVMYIWVDRLDRGLEEEIVKRLRLEEM